MRILPFLLLVPTAQAMQLELDDSQLCGLSTHVVVAEVTSTEVRWSEGPDGGIETHMWLAVDQVVRGPQLDTLELVMPGGELGGLRHWVEDVPDLREDQSYTLFVTETPVGNMVVGGEQGARFIKPGADSRAVAAAVKASVGACVAP